MGTPRAAVLAVGCAIAAAALSGNALAQGTLRSAAASEPRYEAPIGHRQPRAQDLPSSVVRDEDRMKADQDALDKKLESSICRGC